MTCNVNSFVFFATTLCLLILSSNIQALSVNSEALYTRNCGTCHDKGNAGSPQISDVETWNTRLQKDYDTLVQHSLHGYKSMPAKGGNSKLSNAQVTAALDFMLDKVVRAIETSKKNKSSSQANVSVSTGSLSTTTSTSLASSLQLSDVQSTDQNHYHQPPPNENIPRDKYGDDVRLGMNIFTQTSQYASRYTRNGLTCSNCHNNAGRKAHSAPMWGAFGMYPAYRSKNDRNNSLEDRIQQCFRFSLNGFAPAVDSSEIRALVSYIHFLSTGAPIGINLPGRGFLQISKTGSDASPSRGAESYHSKCSYCHGSNGAGEKLDEGGYKTPALWGMGSYNKGAGFYRNELLAGFIKANMPPDKNFSLSDQEVLDLAAYINLQVRPWDPREGIFKGLFD